MRPILTAGARAVLSTAVTTVGGTVAERSSLPGGFIAFATQCALSNIGAVPSAHAAYELAWSCALPVSLTLAVIAASLPADSSSEGVSAAKGSAASGEEGGSMGGMLGVGVAFLLASLGSVLGSAIAFALATAEGARARAMPRTLAAQVAGAVTATYVGGSANFAQVARHLGLPASVLGALAACDIGLMGIYFAALSLCVRSPGCRAWIEGRRRHGDGGEGEGGDWPKEGAAGTASAAGRGDDRQAAPAALAAGDGPGRRASAAGWLVVLAFGATAARVGSLFTAFPGSSTIAAVAAAALVGCACGRAMPRRLLGPMRHAASSGASVCLVYFYAAVGASARFADVAGSGTPAACFIATALAVHVAVAAIGTAALNRAPWLLHSLGLRRRLSLAELLVGSNAAIGGPSTAAAFAGGLGPALVLPAAGWGIAGYAGGTWLGVAVNAALSGH